MASGESTGSALWEDGVVKPKRLNWRFRMKKKSYGRSKHNINKYLLLHHDFSLLCVFSIHDVSDALSLEVFNLCAGCKSLQHLCKVGATRVILSNVSRVNVKQKVEDTCCFTFQRCSNFTIQSHKKAANCNFAFHGNSLNECHGSLFFGHFSRKTSRSLSSLVIK